VIFEEVEHLRPGQRRKRGRGQQREDPGGGHVAGQARAADLAAGGMLEHAFAQLGCHRARPAAHHLGAVRAGEAVPAHQDLGAEGLFQAPPGAVKQCLGVFGGQTERHAQVHVMPASEIERLTLVGGHAHNRAPRHQPGVGIALAGPGGRLIGEGRLDGTAPAAFRAGQRVKPRTEQFGVRQLRDVGLGDDERVAQRGLRDFAIPEHAPAVPEQPVTVCVKKLDKRTWQPRAQVGRDLGVTHAEKLEQTGAPSHLFKVTRV
jgi:hypothetical protein